MYASRPPQPPNHNTEIVDWSALVPLIVNKRKVLIIEAIRWIGKPTSAVQLEKVFDKTIDLSSISYHVKSLAKLGILKQVWKRPVRGAVERFYFFTDTVSRLQQG